MDEFNESLTIEIVECMYLACSQELRPDDAVWDDHRDMPYCSVEHKELGGDEQFSAEYNFQATIFGENK